MRQIQKMQIGMALAALMLCFSPVSAWFTQSKAATVRISSVDSSLRATLHTDFSQDGSMVWYTSSLGQAERPLVSVSRRDGPKFVDLLRGLSNADRVGSVVRAFPYRLNVYQTSGQLHRTFRMSADGTLKDLETGLTFTPQEPFRQFAVAHVVHLHTKLFAFGRR